MDAAIAKNTNDELKTLQVKLSILEDELRKALVRAETAEHELEQLKNLKAEPTSAMPMLPPPPPPPMPSKLLYSATPLRAPTSGADEASFSDSIARMHDQQRNTEAGEGLSQKLIETVKQQVQPEAATGRW